MKIVQSFWTGNISNISDNNFGWQSPYYHLISWVLSCNQLKKYYNEIELYTDKLGHEILINQLNLPYTAVHIVLDELNEYDNNLWALAKIKTYQLQDKPFLHVDGDVFVWNNFPSRFKDSSLIAQNVELITNYYNNMWNEILPNLEYIPKTFKKDNNGLGAYASNMGVVGGTDLSFFKHYCEEAFEFVNKNKSSWKRINSFNFNIFFEQVLFHKMMTNGDSKINYLFDVVPEDNNYKGFSDFDKVPHKKTYLHLLGDYKKNHQSILAMRDYVIKKYPVEHKKILDILNVQSNEESFKSYYIEHGNHNILSEIDIFKKNLDKANFTSSKYLFRRNLLYVDLPKHYDEMLSNSDLINLKRLPCNDIVEDNGLKFLRIEELNYTNDIIPMDELDEMIFHLISIDSKYKSLFNNIEEYLEESVLENQDHLSEFKKIIFERVRFFITKKVLFPYFGI